MPRKIKEKTFKTKFISYLRSVGGKNICKNQDGVDIVANIGGTKKYFELKTSTYPIANKHKYFGAMSQSEWECALAHPNDFFLVHMWKDKDSGNFFFKLYNYTQLYDYESLEPYGTYLHIPEEEIECNFTDTQQAKVVSPTFRIFSSKRQKTEETEMLLSLSRFYNALKIQLKLKKYYREKNEYPVLLITPLSISLNEKRILKGNKINILRYSIDTLLTDDTEDDEIFYSVIAVNPKIIDEPNGRLKKELKITRNNRWITYYRLGKKVAFLPSDNSKL